MNEQKINKMNDIAASYVGKRILVTGSSGYLASNLIESLKNTPCTICRLSRNATRLIPVDGAAHVIDLTGDVSLRATWEQALENVDFVFHFAAQTSVYVASENPLADLESNVLPMLHLLESCRVKDWQPVILFSGTVTEAGIPVRWPVDETHPDRPTNVYDLHKWMAEGYLKCYIDQGLVRGAVLRLANVYGPGPKSSSGDRGVLNMMIRKALKGETLTVYGKGDYLRDYVHVQDVVRAFLMAGANIQSVNGQHFVIGSGQGHTLAEAFNLVADRVAFKTEQRVSVVHIEPPMPQASIESRNFVADSQRFTKATGWQARWSLIQGIDSTIEAFDGN